MGGGDSWVEVHGLWGLGGGRERGHGMGVIVEDGLALGGGGGERAIAVGEGAEVGDGEMDSLEGVELT